MPDDERDGDGQQQPPTLTEQRDALDDRTDAYVRFITGRDANDLEMWNEDHTQRLDDEEVVRKVLQAAASEGRGDAKSLLEEHDRLAGQIQEEEKARAEEKRQAEFSSELARRKAEIRAERQKAAAEEAQAARDAALRALAERELEEEVAVGAGGAETESDLSRFRHLEMQRGQLDYRSPEANEIREQQIELAASMESGNEVTADVDPAEFEKLLEQGRS